METIVPLVESIANAIYLETTTDRLISNEFINFMDGHGEVTIGLSNHIMARLFIEYDLDVLELVNFNMLCHEILIAICYRYEADQMLIMEQNDAIQQRFNEAKRGERKHMKRVVRYTLDPYASSRL